MVDFAAYDWSICSSWPIASAEGHQKSISEVETKTKRKRGKKKSILSSLYAKIIALLD